MEITSMQIKFNLSKLLGEKRYSQKEFADRAGLSYPFVNKLYNETFNSIRIKDLEKICSALNIHIKDLWDFQ